MILLQALYFALPMYLANMAPVIVKKLPILKIPIDGGRMYKGKPVLGKNKTWRGFIAGALFGVGTIKLQALVFMNNDFVQALSVYDYTSDGLLWLGLLMGVGALAGDSLKSFFKRRKGIPSGRPWILFDQLDFVVGGLVLGAIIYWPGYYHVLAILLITPVLHILTNLIAFKLKMKDVPW